MSRNKLLHKRSPFACATLLLFSVVSYASQVHATQPQSRNLLHESNHTLTLEGWDEFHSFGDRKTPIHLSQKFPPNGEPTGRRRGGTGRDDSCPDLKTPVTALVPGNENSNKSLLALTVAEYPTFWIYLPELPKKLRSGEFVLQDEQGNDVYRTPLTLSGKPGAIAISLPSNPLYSLKQNLKYHWFFRVYCSEPQNQEYLFVDAWLQRVALNPEVQRQLKTAKQREYTVYAANNLWYDAITSLGERRRINPSDRVLAKEWNNLLKTIGLSELAEEPILLID